MERRGIWLVRRTSSSRRIPAFIRRTRARTVLHGGGEYKTSLLGTLYMGYQVQRVFHGLRDGLKVDAPESDRDRRYNTDFILDIESAGGRGLSEALGLAGFTNLDVVRNPNLGSTPYVARAQFHQTIGFTSEMTDAERGLLSLATKVPVRRLDLRFGKMSLPDVVDLNGVLSDSHLQFTNWTVDNNGAWDYAADTRGYTYAATVEYQDRIWAARFALALMPTVANGINLDWALSRARGQNYEVELRKGLLPGPFSEQEGHTTPARLCECRAHGRLPRSSACFSWWRGCDADHYWRTNTSGRSSTVSATILNRNCPTICG